MPIHTLTRQMLVAVFVLLLGTSALFSQKATWELSLGQPIYSHVLSTNGKYLIYLTKNDGLMLECLNAQTGTKLWSRPIGELRAPNFATCRFIDSNMTVLSTGKGCYEFLNPEDGSIITTLPLASESWSDLKLDWLPAKERFEKTRDAISPHFRNNIGFFYFDDGFQIIDLLNRTIIYQSTYKLSSIKYYEYKNKLLINPIERADSFYIVDLERRSLFYKGSIFDHQIGAGSYTPFYVNGNELFFLTDHDQSVDAITGKTNASIDIRGSDYSILVPLKKGLHYLVSDDGIQKMYSTINGKLLWTTTEGQIPGIVEQYIEVANDHGLLMSYQDDGKMFVYKVDNTTGAVAWSKHLFTQDDDFEPVKSVGWSPNKISYEDDKALFALALQDSIERRKLRISRNNIHDMYDSWYNSAKSSTGYTSVLSQTAGNVMLVTAGNIYSPSNAAKEKYDGEAIMTLNLSDGSVLDSTRGQILADSEDDDINAYRGIKQIRCNNADADILIGKHDVYLVKGGKVEHYSFGEETDLTFISANDSSFAFRAFHGIEDAEFYDYWRYEVSQTPVRRILMARSDIDVMTFDDSSTARVTVQINADGGYLGVHKLMVGDVRDADFAAPLWSINGAEMGKLELTSFQTRGIYESRQGIKQRNNKIYIMSNESISAITIDGKCQWVHDWDPRAALWGMDPTVIGDYLMFSIGDDTRIIHNDCAGDVVGKHEIGLRDLGIQYSQSGTVVVIDRDNSVFYGYMLR